MDKNELRAEIQNQETIKEIAHTIIHRMTPQQFIRLGESFCKEYDSACEKIGKLTKELDQK